MPEDKYVVWRRHNDAWSRATQPVFFAEAKRLRDAGNSAQLHGDLYKILPEHEIPS